LKCSGGNTLEFTVDSSLLHDKAAMTFPVLTDKIKLRL
jgi:hypothetical protein